MDTDDMNDITHKVGDRWRHDSWLATAPDAVVGAVSPGYVSWSNLGAGRLPGILARCLHPGLGWYRVHVTV